MENKELIDGSPVEKKSRYYGEYRPAYCQYDVTYRCHRDCPRRAKNPDSCAGSWTHEWAVKDGDLCCVWVQDMAHGEPGARN